MEIDQKIETMSRTSRKRNFYGDLIFRDSTTVPGWIRDWHRKFSTFENFRLKRKDPRKTPDSYGNADPGFQTPHPDPDSRLPKIKT